MAARVKEGVVVVIRDDRRLLIIQRAAHIFAGGAWCFVGGGIEPGETQAEAVAREFTEEVGGAVTPGRKIWEYLRPDGRLRLHWWTAELISDPATLQPNAEEVAALRWAAPDEVARLSGLLESNRRFLQSAAFEALMTTAPDQVAGSPRVITDQPR
jgi:8-oxo-dGTP diphosphatase